MYAKDIASSNISLNMLFYLTVDTLLDIFNYFLIEVNLLDFRLTIQIPITSYEVGRHNSVALGGFCVFS